MSWQCSGSQQRLRATCGAQSHHILKPAVALICPFLTGQAMWVLVYIWQGVAPAQMLANVPYGACLLSCLAMSGSHAGIPLSPLSEPPLYSSKSSGCRKHSYGTLGGEAPGCGWSSTLGKYWTSHPGDLKLSLQGVLKEGRWSQPSAGPQPSWSSRPWQAAFTPEIPPGMRLCNPFSEFVSWAVAPGNSLLGVNRVWGWGGATRHPVTSSFWAAVGGGVGAPQLFPCPSLPPRSKGSRTITFEQFKEALEELSKKRFKDKSGEEAVREVHRLVEGKSPIISGVTVSGCSTYRMLQGGQESG